MNICVTPHCNPSTKKRDTASRRIGVNERTDNRPTDRRTDGRPESTMPSPPYCCHRCQSWSRKSHLKRTPSMNVHRFLQLLFKHSYTYTRLHQILDGHVQLAPAYRTDQSTSNINELLNCYSCTWTAFEYRNFQILPRSDFIKKRSRLQLPLIRPTLKLTCTPKFETLT